MKQRRKTARTHTPPSLRAQSPVCSRVAGRRIVVWDGESIKILVRNDELTRIELISFEFRPCHSLTQYVSCTQYVRTTPCLASHFPYRLRISCIRHLSEFGYNDEVFLFCLSRSSSILFHLPYFMFVILKCMRIQLCTLFELNEREERKQSSRKKKNGKYENSAQIESLCDRTQFYAYQKIVCSGTGIKRQETERNGKKRWNVTDCLHHLLVLFFFLGYIWFFDPVAKRPVKYSFKIVNSILGPNGACRLCM